MSNPCQNKTVFISSTYQDLISYREAVRNALHRTEMIVRGMEYFGAGPERPKQKCLESVRSCEFYVGIIAMRYGSIDEESGLSMTHLEYREARRMKIPTYVYFLNEKEQPWLTGYVDKGENAEKLDMFKEEMKKDNTICYFTSEADLSAQVSSNIMMDMLNASDFAADDATNKDKLRERDDEKAEYLIAMVEGNGCRPTLREALHRCAPLIKHLLDNSTKTSASIRAKAWFRVSIAFMNFDHVKRLGIAKKYYEKGVEAYKEAPSSIELDGLQARSKTAMLFYEGNIDEALATIRERTDPKSINMYIGVLFDLGRFEQIEEFLAEKKVHIEWASLAIESWSHLGKLDVAERTYVEAKACLDGPSDTDAGGKSKVTVDDLKVSFAKALMYDALKQCGYWESGKVAVKEIPTPILASIDRALQFALNVARRTSLSKMPSDALCEDAAQICLDAYNLMGDRLGAIEMAWRLAQLRPIKKDITGHLIVNLMSLEMEEISYLDEALASDHPKELWAAVQRSMIRFGRPDFKGESVWELLSDKLSTLSGGEEDRRRACNIFLHAGHEANRLEESVGIIQECLVDDKPFMAYIRAQHLSLRKQYDLATTALSSLELLKEDNEFQSEIYAELGLAYYHTQQWELAKEFIEKSLSLATPSQEQFILPHLIRILQHLKDYSGLVDVISRMQEIDEVDDALLLCKAQSLFNLRRYEDAELVLTPLYEKEPDNKAYAYGMANIIGWKGDYSKAARMLAPFCIDNDAFDMEALRYYVHSLEMSSNVEAAYEAMKRVQDRFGEKPEVLLKYMDLARKAGDDAEAGRIFQQLAKMEEAGKVPSNLMQKKDIADLEGFVRGLRDRDQKTQKAYRGGNIPREVLCSKSMFPDFIERTQSLPDSWTPEEKARFTTYTTYGFRFRDMGEEVLVKFFFGLPENAHSVVITYTALITLYNLHLLHKISDRFDNIYYCQDYRHIWTAEVCDLQPPKKQGEALLALNKMLHDRGILVKSADCEEDQNKAWTSDLALARSENCLLVDYYEIDTDFSVIKMGQLLQWMNRKNIIPKQVIAATKEWSCMKRPITEDKAVGADLDSTDKLVFTSSALTALHDLGILGKLRHLGKEILVSDHTAQKIQQGVDVIINSQAITSNLENMIRTVRDSAAFQPFTPLRQEQPHQLPPSLIATFSSVEYASKKHLPLISDDRAIQTFFEETLSESIFGSDALLVDFFHRGIITEKELAEAYLQLLKWRYRFLVPPLNVLLYWIQQYPDTPPGMELREIAKYAHDCMMDPGLLVDPPSRGRISIPKLFYSMWVESAIDLIIAIWDNAETFAQDKAFAITKWVLEEFIPPQPPLEEGDIAKIKLGAKEPARLVVEPILRRFVKWDCEAPRSKEMFHSVMEILCHDGNLNEYICDNINRFLFEIKNDLLRSLGHENRKKIVERFIMQTIGAKFPLNAKLATTLAELAVKMDSA